MAANAAMSTNQRRHKMQNFIRNEAQRRDGVSDECD